MKKDAIKLQTWSKTKSAWLDANFALACYANVYTIWDAVRMHAEQAATYALAGKYTQSAAELDRMTAASTSLADRMAAVVC